MYLTIGEYLDRFEITFDSASKQALSVEENSNKNFQVYFSNEKKSVIIHNPLQINIESVSIYNMLGQVIYKTRIQRTDNYFEFKSSQTNTGINIVLLKTINGIISKKVLIK